MKQTLFVLASALLLLTGCGSNDSNDTATKNLCANCYWETTCGSISTEAVVTEHLVNENPGEYYGQSYSSFSCSNGSAVLGVKWTNGSCGETGGLSNVPSSYAVDDIFDRQECQYTK